MDYENELRFLQRLLGRLNVQMLRFAPDSPPEVDLGLRRLAGLPPFPAVSLAQEPAASAERSAAAHAQ